MRRRIGIGGLMLVVLLLCLKAGVAEEYYTLPEVREQAKGGWHKTYEDAYGRSIPVDIDVNVFGEDAAPVLKVTYTDYRNHKKGETLSQNDLLRVIFQLNNPHDCFGFDPKHRGDIKLSVYRVDGQIVDWDRAYGEDYGNSMTAREMLTFMERLLDEQDIPVESFLIDRPKSFKVWCKVRPETGELLASAFYYVRFWQQMHGLPIFEHAMASFYKGGWPFYTPYMYFSCRSENEYKLVVCDLKEQEMLAPDIPLCSFDRVMEELEKRIESGHIREVFSLDFGYSLYNDPNFPRNSRSAYDAECYYAVPSWVIECIYVDDPKRDYSYEKEIEIEPYINGREASRARIITINAQTGEMLDPMDRSNGGYGDAVYHGYLTWEDVQ